MRPQRLNIAGFGAFREPAEIDLEDVDLFALVGATGAGKSTVIDAITFALYGSVARYDRNNLVAPAINQRSNEARLRLDFELGGATYTAVRVVRRTGNGATTREARLERGDEIIAASASEMTEAVGALLGLDVDQFNRTVVLPQGQFANFLRATASERQKTLRQLLGFDLYHRIGVAARRRADQASTKATTLHDEIEQRSAELTDQRRADLEARSQRLRDQTTTARRIATELAKLDQQRADATAEHSEITTSLARIEQTTPPSDLEHLLDSLEAASDELDAAHASLAAARERRTAARAAVDAGPDPVHLRWLIERHERLSELAEQHSAAREERDGAAETQARLDAEVDAANQRQQELDTAEATARKALKAAEKDAGALDRSSIERALATLDELDTATDELARFESELATANEEFERLTADAQAADREHERALAAVRDARDRAGVASHTHLLEVGEPCPLCQQTVIELPGDVSDEAVDAAQAQVTSTETTKRATDAKLETARIAAQRAEARRDSALEQRDRLRAASAELAGRDELTRQLEAAIDAERTVAERRADVEAARQAADAHRDDDRRRRLQAEHQGATAKVAKLGGRLDELASAMEQTHDELADEPDVEAARTSLEEAEQRATELTAADRAVDAAEGAVTAATEQCDQLEQQRQDALEALQRAREQLAGLDPPLTEGSISERWRAFDEWRVECRATLQQRAEKVASRIDDLDHQRQDHLEALTTLDVDDADHTDPSAVADSLAERAARTAQELTDFDARRADLDRTRNEAATAAEHAQVAEQLGRLLRANRFEQWLMRSALEQLTERATERLFELSSGRYSLVLDTDDSFAVRDHTNANETRPAMTLSGGETFLASLSLALALSDATAELATDDAPPIESIFLDEGFGTLDPDTLDIVATAIEELGAGGRMVGIITHIRDLADRMPVRLEVTHTAAGATVERVEL